MGAVRVKGQVHGPPWTEPRHRWSDTSPSGPRDPRAGARHATDSCLLPQALPALPSSTCTPRASGSAPSLMRSESWPGPRSKRVKTSPTAANLARIWHMAATLCHRPLEPGTAHSCLTCGFVAEREGFEPPGHLRDRLLSRQLQSTRLCHRSKPVRRLQVYQAAPVQTLFYQILATVCGQDIQPVMDAAGHSLDNETG
jgi:hypothetical protein